MKFFYALKVKQGVFFLALLFSLLTTIGFCDNPFSSDVKVSDTESSDDDSTEIAEISIAKVAGIEKIDEGYPIEGKIVQDNLRLRSWPWGAIVKKYNKGTIVKVLGESGEFYLVEVDGQQGYMHKSYISTSKEKASLKIPSYPGNTKTGGYLTLKKGVEASKEGAKQLEEQEDSDTSDNSSTTANDDNGSVRTGKFDIANKKGLVAICYSTWFDPVINSNSNPPIIQDCLDGKRGWGSMNSFHYWGKPALGFYKSTNKSIIKKHMTMLNKAGIDFIILDNTNVDMSWQNGSYWSEMVDKPCTALLDTIVEMRANGQPTPYVVNWIGGSADCVNSIYNKFYTKSKYKGCWIYWNGKPFIITTKKFSGLRSDITTRVMWGLNPNLATSEWSFLMYPNKASYDSNGNPEQICVCTALQADYMSNSSSATGRRGGLTFYEEWEKAFDVRPKVVTLTWWNEWCAQRFEGNKFVDNYTMEYSRDIEPMEGGHGDKYYKWMCEYIAAYKADENCPRLVD